MIMRINFFYLNLLKDKILGIMDSSNKLKILRAEAMVLSGKFPYVNEDIKNRSKFITTKIGNNYFVTRNTCVDFLTVSSAFEKQDVNEMSKRIKKALDSRKQVLFVDIGANFGKYTVLMGKLFSTYGKQFKILSFEPEKNTYKLLQKNIKLNRLSNVSAYNLALGNLDGKSSFYLDKDTEYITRIYNPGSPSLYVKTAKLDDFLPKPSRELEIFVKLDVEGHEVPVLRGAKSLSKKYSKVTILVEDCMPANYMNLTKYLSKIAKLSAKVSPYNSFWTIS
jgi:FkbM family methyltransferase